jgi:hypothetical protein
MRDVYKSIFNGLDYYIIDFIVYQFEINNQMKIISYNLRISFKKEINFYLKLLLKKKQCHFV